MILVNKIQQSILFNIINKQQNNKGKNFKKIQVFLNNIYNKKSNKNNYNKKLKISNNNMDSNNNKKIQYFILQISSNNINKLNNKYCLIITKIKYSILKMDNKNLVIID